MRLLAAEDDSAVELLLPQHAGERAAGMPGPDDHHGG